MNDEKIPFKISARTARLIGRQNFPNSEGAIIELVKNSYDADSSTSIIIFDNKYAEIPKIINEEQFSIFKEEFIDIRKFYEYKQYC